MKIFFWFICWINLIQVTSHTTEFEILPSELIHKILSKATPEALRNFSETSLEYNTLSQTYLFDIRNKIHLEEYCPHSLILALSSSPLSIFADSLIAKPGFPFVPRRASVSEVKCLIAYTYYRNATHLTKEIDLSINPLRIKFQSNPDKQFQSIQNKLYINAISLFLSHPNSEHQLFQIDIPDTLSNVESQNLFTFIQIISKSHIKYLIVVGNVKLFLSSLNQIDRFNHIETLRLITTLNIELDESHMKSLLDMKFPNYKYFIHNKKLNDTIDDELSLVIEKKDSPHLYASGGNLFLNSTRPTKITSLFLHVVCDDIEMCVQLLIDTIPHARYLNKLQIFIYLDDFQTLYPSIISLFNATTRIEYLKLQIERPFGYFTSAPIPFNLSFLESLHSLKYFEYIGMITKSNIHQICAFIKHTQTLESVFLDIAPLGYETFHPIVHTEESILEYIQLITDSIDVENRIEEITLKVSIVNIDALIVPFDPLTSSFEFFNVFCVRLWMIWKVWYDKNGRNILFNGVSVSKAVELIGLCNDTERYIDKTSDIQLSSAIVPKYALNIFL